MSKDSIDGLVARATDILHAIDESPAVTHLAKLVSVLKALSKATWFSRFNAAHGGMLSGTALAGLDPEVREMEPLRGSVALTDGRSFGLLPYRPEHTFAVQAYVLEQLTPDQVENLVEFMLQAINERLKAFAPQMGLKPQDWS